MREPRGNLEKRLESVARAKRREQRPELRKASWREPEATFKCGECDIAQFSVLRTIPHNSPFSA